jgi:hypothetical protein
MWRKRHKQIGGFGMRSSRLALAGRLSVALLVVLAFGGLVAAAAQAEEAPYWTREDINLIQGETHYVTAKSYKKTTLEIASLGITVSCPALKLKGGALLGSSTGEPGTSTEIIEFEKSGTENCTQTGNGAEPGCKVKEPIKTLNVRSELAEDTTKKKLLVEFKPEGARFATIEYEEAAKGDCTKAKETAVEGSLAAEVLTDPNNGTLGEAVKQGEAKSWLINFPATPIKKIWLIKAGVGSEVSVGLLSATEEAKFGGTALVLLANEKHETEEASWGLRSKERPNWALKKWAA